MVKQTINQAKPKVSDRTVNMFTGSTNEEARAQSDIGDDSRSADPSIEGNMDRYRDKAFELQEFFSKKYSEPSDKEVFRVTVKGPHMYLEKKSSGPGEAYGYTGVMFKTDSLYEITTALVNTWKGLQTHGKSA